MKGGEIGEVKGLTGRDSLRLFLSGDAQVFVVTVEERLPDSICHAWITLTPDHILDLARLIKKGLDALDVVAQEEGDHKTEKE